MNLILAAILLCGPPGEPMRATVPLSIHLGRDQRSAIARSELARVDPFFSHRRFVIETRFRLTIDEDEYSMPTYSLGSGDTRHTFPTGAFSASGSFIRTIESLCAIDRWERTAPDVRTVYTPGVDGWAQEVRSYRDEKDKPEQFPPTLP